jgi:hypothetical protein
MPWDGVRGGRRCEKVPRGCERVQEVVEAARGCEKVRKGVKRCREDARRCRECFGCYERAQEGWRVREGMIYEGSYTISNTMSRKETR